MLNFMAATQLNKLGQSHVATVMHPTLLLTTHLELIRPAVGAFGGDFCAICDA